MAKQQHAYIGIAPCGCIQAAWLDAATDVAEEVLQILDWGRVERVSLDAGPVYLCTAEHNACPHPGGCPQHTRPEAGTSATEQPKQSICRDDRGVLRYRKNAIVEYLFQAWKADMNTLAILSFSREDRAQFAQLLGYSLDGFEDLPYAHAEKSEG